MYLVRKYYLRTAIIRVNPSHARVQQTAGPSLSLLTRYFKSLGPFS